MNRYKYLIPGTLALLLLVGTNATADLTKPAPTPALQTASPSPNLPTGTVISVGDGDTFRMAYQGQLLTIRMACIDAPESTQVPYGPAAAARLRELLPKKTEIRFREVDRDRYGRVVAEVYLLDGTSVNLKLVQEGQAVVYRQYLSACPESRETLLAEEAQARRAKLNFWSQANPLMPWDYRQGLTSSPPLPEPTPTTPVPIRDPQRGRCDCPYDLDNAGRACGDRSSYSRSGGTNRICYVGEGP
ncbi:MAG: thermonuclease family protein [Cyanobacteria bacterium REEB459]|nr:thermonuclease family protein [Cyanobacteria bacterium REEB459]